MMEDYISREAALYALEQNVVDCNPDHFAINTRDGFGNWSHDSGWNGGITAARCTIKAIPAADVVPVVHAEWIDDAGAEKCSFCRMRFPDLYPLYDAAHYCPNCGARMVGRQEKCEAQKRDLENARRSMEEAIATPVVDVTRWQYPQLMEEAKQDALD